MFSTAKYMIRLDDASPTYNSARWARVLGILELNGIKPLIGVIPDCCDPDLLYQDPDPYFWNTVRAWSASGIAIAMHGLNHKLVDVSPVHNLILGSAAKGEFLNDSQCDKIRQIGLGLNIFSGHGIGCEWYMPPAHGIDVGTVHALVESGIFRYITDGHSFRPYRKEGITWIPQQLWRLRWMPFGLWTVCLHPSSMSEAEICKFAEDARKYSSAFVSPSALVNEFEALSEAILDRFSAKIFEKLYLIRRRVK